MPHIVHISGIFCTGGVTAAGAGVGEGAAAAGAGAPSATAFAVTEACSAADGGVFGGNMLIGLICLRILSNIGELATPQYYGRSPGPDSRGRTWGS